MLISTVSINFNLSLTSVSHVKQADRPCHQHNEYGISLHALSTECAAAAHGRGTSTPSGGLLQTEFTISHHAAMRVGVDCWLGRGCDPVTGRWLEAVALHSIQAGNAGDDSGAGALAGLQKSVLSPKYMADWSCDLREREIDAIATLLRAVCAADGSVLVRSGDEEECDESSEGFRVVSVIRRALCETQ